jgi:hypothetical protein
VLVALEDLADELTLPILRNPKALYLMGHQRKGEAKQRRHSDLTTQGHAA